MKILFVCLGNICRSPLAEAIFTHKIKGKGLEDYFQADSCGTANYHVGDWPDPRTIRTAAKHGIEIQHTGRQIVYADLENFDLILPMDHSNFTDILKLKNSSLFSDKIQLMRTFDPIDTGEDVPDPYHGSDDDFQEVFEILDRSVDSLILSLEKKSKKL